MQPISLITMIALGLIFAPPTLANTVFTETLEGSAWILAELPSETLLEDVTVTLAFEDGRVVGTDGCNRYHGSYTLEDGVLRLGKLAATMMACPDAIMRQARAFNAALERVRGARIDDGELLLLDADDIAVARFDPQSQALADTRWIVTGYNNGKQALVMPVEAIISLDFDDTDGLRIAWPEAREWLHVRPSGTEPLIRVMVEADNEALLADVIEEVGGVIERYA